jgi:hypothetical protein
LNYDFGPIKTFSVAENGLIYTLNEFKCDPKKIHDLNKILVLKSGKVLTLQPDALRAWEIDLKSNNKLL